MIFSVSQSIFEIPFENHMVEVEVVKGSDYSLNKVFYKIDIVEIQ